jgi:toxin ParE1/3/4
LRLIYTDPAERDLLGILQWISSDNPGAAEGVYRAIVATAERLRAFPSSGRAGRLPNTRELTVRSLPYVIVYEVTDEIVTVLAILHGARNLSEVIVERRRER